MFAHLLRMTVSMRMMSAGDGYEGSDVGLLESGVYAAKATASIIMLSNSTGVSFPSRRCRRLR